MSGRITAPQKQDVPAGFDAVTLTLPRAPDPVKFARLKVSVQPWVSPPPPPGG